jgi:hypothetical protein
MDDDSQTQKNKNPNKQGLVIKMQQLHQQLRINRRNDYQINNRKYKYITTHKRIFLI